MVLQWGDHGAGYGLVLGSCHPLRGKSLHLSRAPSPPCASRGIATLSPGWTLGDLPCGRGSLLPGPHHLCPSANAPSILVETARRHHLLSALFLLSHPVPVSRDFGAPESRQTLRCPFCAGQSGLPLVSRLLPFLPPGYAEPKRLLRRAALPRVCSRPVPAAPSLPPSVGRGWCSCFSSPCQACEEFAACETTDDPSQRGAEAEAVAQGGPCGRLFVCPHTEPSFSAVFFLMPMAPMFPSTEGPWRERGEVIACPGAGGIHGFLEMSSVELTLSPEQEMGLLREF